MKNFFILFLFTTLALAQSYDPRAVKSSSATVTDNCIPTFNLTSGKIIQCNGTLGINDSGEIVSTNTNGNIVLAPNGTGDVVISSSKSFGIGTTSPDVRFDMEGTDANIGMRLLRQSADTGAPYLHLIKGRESGVYPSSADALGSISFGSTNGTTFNTELAISSFATEAHSATASGRDLRFYTAANTTNTGTVRMTIAESGNVMIGTSTDSASSILNVSSTTKGFVPPRMTTVQKNAIGTPVEGMIVADTNLDKLAYYNGSAWESVASSSERVCYAAFGGAGSLAAPTECVSGACTEYYDNCGTFSPPSWLTVATYQNATFAAGTFSNSSLVDCKCQAFDSTTGLPRQCNLFWETGDNSLTSSAGGGYVTNMITLDNAGTTQATSFILLKCTGTSP